MERKSAQNLDSGSEKNETVETWLKKMPPVLVENVGGTTSRLSLPGNTGTTVSTFEIPSGSAKSSKREKKEKRKKEKKDKASKNPIVTFSPPDEEIDQVLENAPKVDRAQLHRAVLRHKESITTKPKYSKMSPRMQAYLAESQAKKVDKSETKNSKKGWRNSWDVYVPNYQVKTFKKKQKKEKSVKIETPAAIKRRRNTKGKANINTDIFGYLSTLDDNVRIICREYSTSDTYLSDPELEEESMGRDMTWLRELSLSQDDVGGNLVSENKTEHKEIKDSMYLLWLFLTIGGRMPFNFVRSQNPGSGAVCCKLDRHRRQFYIFFVISLFLLFLTFVTIISFVGILFSTEDLKDPLTQIDKLLLDKNWVNGMVFVMSLVMATISSFSVLVSGESMAQYITHWEESLDELNFNATPGIRFVTTLFIFWSIVVTLTQAVLFYYKRDELNPFIEGIHLSTELIFRNFVPDVLTSEDRNIYAAFALFLKSYALYCSRSFILLIMVYSVGITNLANEWNFRLRLILRQITTTDTESTLKKLIRNINYQKLFDEHQRIAKLLKEMSKVFGFIIITFYITQAIVCSGELVEISTYITGLVGNNSGRFNQTHAEKVNYTYDKNIYNRMDVAFSFSQTVAILLIVSLYLSSTGTAVMDALNFVRRHSLMNIMSTHERGFVMSLMMSYNPKQPYLLGAGSLFNIDRHFMYSFFAGAMYFLSVMVQTRIPRLLNVPIVFECATGLCVQNLIVPPSPEIYVNQDILSRFTTTTISTTPSTTTTTATPVQGTFPCVLRGISGAYRFTGETFNCPGTQVRRFHVYNRDASQKTDLELGKTWDCIFFPYPASKGPYYDCFGNKLSDDVDDCGMLNFGNTIGALPEKAPVTIYNGRDGKRVPVSCYRLYAPYYYPEPQDVTDLWYPCGVPRWFARTVCNKKGATDVNLLKARLLKDISTYILARPSSTNPFTIGCGPRAPLTPYELSFSGSTVILDALPIRNWNSGFSSSRFFPFFHPKLFFDDPSLRSISVYQCKGGLLADVLLEPDDCGALDFDGTHAKSNMSGFLCYNPCRTVAECMEWMTWYNTNLPRL